MIHTQASEPSVLVTDSMPERCDRCGAAAKIHVILRSGAGTLTLCGHHANRHAEPIARAAVQVTLETGFHWLGVAGPMP
jgi:hypothetical protein